MDGATLTTIGMVMKRRMASKGVKGKRLRNLFVSHLHVGLDIVFSAGESEPLHIMQRPKNVIKLAGNEIGNFGQTN